MTIKNASRKFGVLVLCGGIYPDTAGGAEVHLFYVCRELAERAHRVFVISPTSKLSTRASETDIPFVRIYIRLWPKPFATLSYIVKSFVESFKLKQQIKIVHAHTANYPVLATAFLFSFLTHKPYIVTCLGSDIRVASRRFLQKIFQMPFLHNAKRILAVSNEISEIVRLQYGVPKRQILAVGTGYDDRVLQELRDTRLPIEAKKDLHIINVANMRPEKDQLTLLRSFARLRKNIKGVRLSLVGDGPLRGQLEKFVAQHDMHDVEFMGMLSHKEALKHVATADAFILTSVEEGMPTVIIEALALGKPVIATVVGGIPEVVTDGVNGILVPPKSPEHIVKALERLMSDSRLRRRLGKAAAKSVKNYTWRRIAEEFETVYSAVVRGN